MTDLAGGKPAAAVQPPDSAIDQPLGSQLRLMVSAIKDMPGHSILYILGGAITLVIIVTAAMQVVLNAWLQPFYDAIEKKALAAFAHQLLVFSVIAGVLLLLNVTQTGLNQAIRLKLREFMTRDLIEHWMTRKRAARIARSGEIGVNPDQRIHADAQHLADLFTGLGIGLLQASLLLVSFIGVLWELSRNIVVNILGYSFVVPGYMVWAALIYALTGSWLSWRVGRRLVRLQQDHYAREADLRVALVRGVEQASGIALNNGEVDEQQQLDGALKGVLTVLWRIVGATVRLTFVTAGYGWGALVFPIIVAAPGYFSGALTFGALMMVVGAFNQVQSQLRWFVDNTGAIADWRATLLRIMSFRQALLNLDAADAPHQRIERLTHPDGHVVLDHVSVASFRGRTELSEAYVDIAPGEHVLLVGKPGAGKSALFLAMAGLWDFGSGRMSLPAAGDIMYLSQKPFMPPGSLRAVLTYANGHHQYTDAELGKALRRVGLDQLGAALDRVERWDTELSIEEQQRLAFGRVLLNRPKWVISDEAIDTMEIENHELVVSIFANELAGTGVISVAGSPPHNGFYKRVLSLVARPVDDPRAEALAALAPAD